ncbi:Nudix hydrolase domain-containing protein [Mycena sanguinolenta]|uniref:Nudix hydrolase domain-containing protein n=1 Tax=Mycena sanguinolenta TaxID=230812 RepID=A0A8H6ZCX1_9AGAR|nr:Nudix hydrolase domain-containing protein [Mycena sanguinolenta]
MASPLPSTTPAPLPAPMLEPTPAPLRSTGYPTTLFFSEDFVVSAGCVLFRRNPTATTSNANTGERGRLEICVLHDLKTDEYVLPKGRKDVGESIAEAAVRETFEETGYPCALLPLRMPTRAPAPGVNTPDAVSVQDGISEPLAVAVRDMRSGGQGIKVVWWFVARATGYGSGGSGWREGARHADRVGVLRRGVAPGGGRMCVWKANV